jgi:hypothetical protein
MDKAVSAADANRGHIVGAERAGRGSFYRRLGFTECGRLARQVRIDGQEDDELLMELFL